MSFFRAAIPFVLVAAMVSYPAAASTASTAKTHTPIHHHKKGARSRRLHGQQAIETSRVIEIQKALIRTHYLTGEPTGKWDATTIAAMQKLQADQGWQTKLMPDSRALKLLGLGPDYSGAINAKGSSFVDPPPVTTIPQAQAQGFAEAAGVDH